MSSRYSEVYTMIAESNAKLAESMKSMIKTTDATNPDDTAIIEACNKVLTTIASPPAPPISRPELYAMIAESNAKIVDSIKSIIKTTDATIPGDNALIEACSKVLKNIES